MKVQARGCVRGATEPKCMQLISGQLGMELGCKLEDVESWLYHVTGTDSIGSRAHEEHPLYQSGAHEEHPLSVDLCCSLTEKQQLIPERGRVRTAERRHEDFQQGHSQGGVWQRQGHRIWLQGLPAVEPLALHTRTD